MTLEAMTKTAFNSSTPNDIYEQGDRQKEADFMIDICCEKKKRLQTQKSIA